MTSIVDVAALDALLDTSAPFDESKVRLLEKLVHGMLTGSPAERQIAHNALSRLKANNEAWRVVGTILQLSTESNTRFFALSILEECIGTRWNILPEAQKNGVKQYVTDMAIKVSTDPNAKDEKYFLTKVNKVLVQVVKQEWPTKWPTFIPDLCAAAKTNEGLCENSMRILSLLSEEIFDFGRDQLTSQRVALLMNSLNAQFQQIYELCMFVIQSSVTSQGVSSSLLTATLQCLAHFLKWIPHQYIFETGLIDILMKYFWDPVQYRIDCVRCFTEICGLKDVTAEALNKLGTSLWVPLIQKVSQLSDSTLQNDARCPAQSRIYWETFYAQLSICLTTFLKIHLEDVCEKYPGTNEAKQLVIYTLGFLDKVTNKSNHEETFKICVDYWHHLSESLLNQVRQTQRTSESLNGNTSRLISENEPSGLTSEPAPIENPELYSSRLLVYQQTLNSVRNTLVSKMARPKEVCIHYDEESGTVDRDYETDTDEVALYNVMRETLIFLTNLGGSEMQDVMMVLLRTLTEDARNPNQKNWNPTLLSRLCWALGSISGSMSAERERSFLVHIIKDLLWLCEHKRGKENKAIVASMIMYVLGQYPRFLRGFGLILETVISKLFEFMHESFVGVQEMACETFLKVCQKCAASLACSPGCKNDNLNIPLVEGILSQLPPLYKILQTPNKQLLLYEGTAHIIAEAPPEKKQNYISQLTNIFAADITHISLLVNNGGDTTSLFQPQVSRKITEILRVYERIVIATGKDFTTHLLSVYSDILKLYSLYSSQISREVASNGPVVMTFSHVKALRSVKRATLLLIKSFVETATTGGNDEKLSFAVREDIVKYILPPLLHPVLEDYRSNVPQARDHEVMSLLTTFVSRLHKNLLPACNQHCFEGIFALPEIQRRYFIESLIWALKHEQPTVADQGLTIMKELLTNVSTTKAEILIPFCRVFYWNIFQEVFSVLTDTLHKSGLNFVYYYLKGFQLQALIIMHLVQLVEMGRISEQESRITKQDVMIHLSDMLLTNFVNLNRSQVEIFVLGLFNKSGQPKDFCRHLRDFLIQLKEFAGSDELFEDEKKQALSEQQELQRQRAMMIPGMLPQYTAAEIIRIEDLE